jgi:hypothetical protein
MLAMPDEMSMKIALLMPPMMTRTPMISQVTPQQPSKLLLSSSSYE